MTTSDGDTRPSARPGLDRAKQATANLKLAAERLATAGHQVHRYVDGEPLPAHVLDALQSAIDAVNVALPAYQSEDGAKKAEHVKAQAHYRAQVTGLILEEQREARHAAMIDQDATGPTPKDGT